MNCKGIKIPPTYVHRTLSHLVRRIVQLKIITQKLKNMITKVNRTLLDEMCSSYTFNEVLHPKHMKMEKKTTELEGVI